MFSAIFAEACSVRHLRLVLAPLCLNRVLQLLKTDERDAFTIYKVSRHFAHNLHSIKDGPPPKKWL
jgi:hypothetical protein